MKLSARNQLAGTVKQVNKGAAIANVVVDVSACGFSISDQAANIVTRVRDKISG